MRADGGCDFPNALCGSRCFDLGNDEQACGACGHACGPAQMCQNGRCLAGCSGINEWSERLDGGIDLSKFLCAYVLSDLAAADLDADGDVELAGVTAYCDPVGVARGNGDGTFGPAVYEDVSTAHMRSITAVDLDGDGVDELLTAEGTIVRLAGDGGLVEEPLPGEPFMQGGRTRVADFNLDGIPEIIEQDDVVADFTIWTLSDGGYVAGPGLDGEDTDHCLMLGDVTGDGRDELAECVFGGGFVRVYASDDAMEFTESQVPFAFDGGRPMAGTFADVSADGVEDVVMIDYDTGRLQVSTLTGGTPVTIGSHLGPLKVVHMQAADVNGDGRPDLFLSSFDQPSSGSQLYVMMSRLDGGFQTARPIFRAPANSWPRLSLTTEVNGDGFADVVVSHDGTAHVLEGRCE